VSVAGEVEKGKLPLVKHRRNQIAWSIPGGLCGRGWEFWWPLKYHISKTRNTTIASMQKPKLYPAVSERRP